MPSLERRINQLETASPLADQEVPVIVVKAQPWCSVGCHPLPFGYLRGYVGITRKAGESEEEFYASTLAIAMEQRGPRCAILLVEDREEVPCTKCPVPATHGTYREGT